METKQINQIEDAPQQPMTQIEDIRHISEAQLAALGVSQIAYLKPEMMNGVKGVAIHAADGTPIAFTGDRDVAEALVMRNEMFPLSVH